MSDAKDGQYSSDMGNTPRRIRAQQTDHLINAMSCTSDMMIQLELEFDDLLDADRLAKALDLTLDAEPVLGCRFVSHWRKPYWERLERSNRETFLFAKDEGEYAAFRNTSMDPYSGPQIKACLWRSSSGDRLLLKVSHEIADAAALKDISCTISNLYSKLASEPHLQPQPNLKGSRSIWQVMRHIRWYSYPRICVDSLRDSWPLLRHPKTYTLPLEAGPRAPLAFAARLLADNQVACLAEYGRARDATLNDVMLAAFFRALVSDGNWDGCSQLRLGTSVDLRGYIPSGRAEGICNLSVAMIGYPDLGTDLGDDFASTMERIAFLTRSRKANWLGMGMCLGIVPLGYLPHGWVTRLLTKMTDQAYKKGYSMYALTNMGAINPDHVAFETHPSNAWLLAPTYPPGLMLGLSGYAGTLTLSAGVYPPQKEAVERFLDRVLSELPV
jgi:NRPS condensation-like uncharacterized protein